MHGKTALKSSASPLRGGPRVVETIAELRDALAGPRQQGQTIGLVPTMGALHAGHVSLVEAAAQRCDVVAVTVFVNPTQFAPNEDFERYPRNLEADLALLAASGAQLVFAPAVTEIYRPGNQTSVDVGEVTKKLEGRFRPDHFRGVATIALKLFEIAQPDAAFFGQKDYQQTLVIRRMVADLDVPVRIEVCRTVRDADGLALSSRNAYLSADERQRALAIPRSLELAANLVAGGTSDAAAIAAKMRDLLAQSHVEPIDYVALVDPETLDDVATVSGPTLAVIAAYVGKTRLIDNMLLEPKPAQPKS